MPYKVLPYNRGNAVDYATRWALSRNPSYYDFDKIGGDCTNFMSQCLYAGSKIMNHTPVTGWYYYSINQRSPSWTSVEYFHKFLMNNKGPGPFGSEVPIEETKIGDIVQLATEHNYFHHACMIISKFHPSDLSQIFIACHTYDSLMRPLSTYDIRKMRCIKIDGVRTSV